MSVRYLLDTNTASYAIKGLYPSVRHRLLRVPMPEIGISAITEAELRFGVVRKPQALNLRRIVEEFLAHVDILPWDSRAANCYANLRGTLESSGTPMGNLDIMIAAQAIAQDLILVTHDRAFERVRNLKLDDWVK